MASLSRCARCGSHDLERYFPDGAVRALDQTRRDHAEGKANHFRTLGRLTPQPDTGR